MTNGAFNEFIIRLPNLIGTIIYLYCAYKISKKFSFSILAFALLTTNYFLNYYFSLARGYGLATSLTLAGISVYLSDRKSYKNILGALVLFVFSSYAILSNTVFVLTFIIYTSLTDIGLKNILAFVRKYFAQLLLLGIFSIYQVFLFLQVTKDGLPLVGNENNFGFYQGVFLGYAAMFTSVEIRQVIFSSVLFGLIGIGILFKKRNILELPSLVLFVTYFSVVTFLSFVMKKPMPEGRVLLPMFPLLVLSVMEALDTLNYSLKTPMKNILFVFCVLATLGLSYNFYKKIDMQDIRNFNNSDEATRRTIYLAAITGEKLPKDLTPQAYFYIEKIETDLGKNFEKIQSISGSKK